MDTLGHSDDFLLKGILLRLECSELLVETNGLSLHDVVVSLDVLLDAMELVFQSFTGVLALHGKNILEGLLLRAKDLDLLLVLAERLAQLTARLGQVGELSLKVRSVFAALGRFTHELLLAHNFYILY